MPTDSRGLRVFTGQSAALPTGRRRQTPTWARACVCGLSTRGRSAPGQGSVVFLSLAERALRSGASSRTSVWFPRRTWSEFLRETPLRPLTSFQSGVSLPCHLAPLFNLVSFHAFQRTLVSSAAFLVGGVRGSPAPVGFAGCLPASALGLGRPFVSSAWGTRGPRAEFAGAASLLDSYCRQPRPGPAASSCWRQWEWGRDCGWPFPGAPGSCGNCLSLQSLET